ncbi:glutathione S-transferase family protein [Tropicimonas marinistellae]|uniref:glutathione S-transferase family protein n=1 Tax=Tropicimonas marinistellae TaxID=1739787 RepID=UPI000837208F|nr:glutathione S-transferase family protein [Tropicimonas marinistellae]
MLTLFHAPQSRATRAHQLLDELGALDRVNVESVTIPRRDGSGARDPKNPHPEGKVPVLVHDGELIWESAAIFLYLTDLFPEAGLGPLPGQPGRGSYLSWLAWYGDVMEPVIHFKLLEIDHPALANTFRGYDDMTARLSDALSGRPYLLGTEYSAADLLLSSTFTWLPDLVPEDPRLKDWVARCAGRPAAARTAAYETRIMGG